MGHQPNIGRSDKMQELLNVPTAEVLGTVKESITTPTPQGGTAAWQSAAGEQVEMTAPPPPWEVEDQSFALSDARRFVDVPSEWELRWVNPRLLDQNGWNYWQPVMGSDPRVKVKVKQMVSVDGNIRRGGQTGDILAWMYKQWVESRVRLRREATARLAGSAVEKQEAIKEEFRRGQFGPYITLTEARHPTHTIADGKSMTDA